MTASVLWLFLAVPLVGLQCVILVFPDHTHLLFWSKFATDRLFFCFCMSFALHAILLSYFRVIMKQMFKTRRSE